MSGLLGGNPISQSATKIEAFKLQSSAFGVAMTLLYGLNRIPGNLLWYGGFQAIPHTTESGGKGGVKTTNTDYTYTACVMMGLCEGQITGVSRIWKGKELFSGGVTPSQLVTTTESYTVSGGGAYTVSHAATYAAPGGVVSIVGIGQDQSVTIYAEGTDYTRVGGAYDFSRIAIGTPLQIGYQYTTGGATQTALQQLGLSFAAGALGQAPWSYLNTYTPPSPPGGATGSQAIGYSGLAYVYAQDYDLGTSAAVDNHTFEVQGPLAYSISTSVPDADPSTITADALTNGRYGAAMPASFIGFGALWSTYCRAANLLMSPALTEQMKAAEFVDTMARLTNSGPVWSGGQLRMVPYGDSDLSGNGVSYTANITPVYDLSDADFIADGGGSPVRVERKSQADAYNHVRVEFRNRANLYNPEIAEAKDSAAIDTYGLRSAEIVTAHWICDATVARNVAQLMLQRSVYVRSTYKFSLPWSKALLEPMDLVTLTDSAIGLSAWPVRVTEVTEGDDGYLDVSAEDYPRGAASAAVYPTQGSAGYQHDYNASPGSVVAPLIFEAPGALTQNGLEVWVAVTGTSPKWGGCHVWGSADGTSYQLVATITGGSRYGALTSAAGSSGGFAVSLNTGVLGSGSVADAEQLTTLCYLCDSSGANPEFFAYQTASLTSALHYTLGGTLPRGQYGTTAAARAAGAKWARCDDSIAKSGPIDLGFVGKTIHVKFTSFNLYGAAEESLASVTDYTYTITGAQILGNAGAAALAASGAANLTLQSTGFAFIFPDKAATTSASPDITFTAELDNLSGTASFSAIAYNAVGSTLGSITLGGSGNVRTLSAAQFNNSGAWATQYVVVTASLSGLSDTTTVYRGNDGSSDVQAALSNEAHTLKAASDGTVGTYVGSGTTIRTFEGVTELSYDGIGTSAGTWKAIATVTSGSITVGTLTDSGVYLTVGDHSAMSTDQATVKYTISGKTSAGIAFSLDKSQSLVKSRAGSDAITVVFANQAHTLPADNSGNVTSYSGSGTTCQVYQGGNLLTYVASAPGVGQWTVGTATVSPSSSITVGSWSGGGTTTATLSAYSGASAAQDVITVSFPITAKLANGDTVNSSVLQTLTKAKQGTTGSTGAAGATAVFAYRTVYGTSLPSPPAVGTGAPTTGNAPTAADDGVWYTQPPSGSLAANYWNFTKTGTLSGGTYSWNSSSYLTTFRVGSLSALSADLGTITAGSITGATVKTASSGARIALNESANNSIKGYTSGGTEMFSLSAASGILSMSSDQVSVTQGAIRVDTSANTGCAISAYGPGGAPAIYGNASGNGTGIKGDSYSGHAGHFASGSSSGTAVYADGSVGGTALYVKGATVFDGGVSFTASPSTGSGTATFPGNNKPGGNSTVSWMQITISGTTYYMPVWS